MGPDEFRAAGSVADEDRAALHVLFLTESFHPVLGGGEQHIRLLAARLVANGVGASVLTRRGDPGWPAEEELDGVRVMRVPPGGPGRRGKYAMVPFALARLLRERRRYDLVVVRGTRVLGLPGLFAARLAGRKVVLQAEVSGEMSGEIYTWGTRFERSWIAHLLRPFVAWRNLLLRDSDGFITISRRTRDEFLNAGLPPEKVHLLPHGVDTRRFRPADDLERTELRRRLGLPPDRLLVVFTGRLLRGKGLETLLAAFRGALETEPRLHLVVVGSGSGQALSVDDELRQAVREGGLEQQVSFVGRVDNVPDYLRAADMFAFPSFFEAMPLSVIEAAACGLACVASRIGGIVDVLKDGESGLLVEPGDAAGLTTVLIRLAQDAGVRQALGAAARQAVLRDFDLDANVARSRALFQEIGAPLGPADPARPATSPQS